MNSCFKKKLCRAEVWCFKKIIQLTTGEFSSNMKFLFEIISIFLLIQLATAPPPRRIEPKEQQEDPNQNKKHDLDDFGLEYNRYLREVIDLLESDPEFKKKLEEAQDVDIRNGQIAMELEFVNHKVRSKLDEVKRQEIERLRHLAQKQYELSNGIDTEHAKISSEHLDHGNPHTFEIEDLKKLIAKVSADLNEADEKRRKEFKEYEMQKEYEKQQKLKHLEGSEREAFEKQLKENETKHKQHERLHEPGSKPQLEEVWEKEDHMENQEFDPKVFFQLHDLDGNGFWDHTEVKALFLKELDKMYQAGAPEDDMKERVEEMERMREHVFNEADKNKDGLISYEEFLEKTKQPDFEKDPGWDSLDQKPVYTHEEYLEFERRRQEEVQRMIQQGLIPPQPVYHGDPYHQGHFAQYPHHPQQAAAHPQQAAGHPQQAAGHPQDHRYASNFGQGQPLQHGYPNQPHQGYPNHPNEVHPQAQAGQGYQYQQQQHGSQQGGVDSQPSHDHQSKQPQQFPGSQQGQANQPNQGNQAYQAHQGNQAYQAHPGNQANQQQYPNQGNHIPGDNQPQGIYQQQIHQNQQPNMQQGHAENILPGASVNNTHQKENDKPQSYQAGLDVSQMPNQVRQQLDLKYSKSDSDNHHPNNINAQYKTLQQNNQKQFSNH
ncbi:hypothetical protein RUM44_009674 [Polyplax serrata]|uniref:EF-hand domain-containing protein n=1 Tax=Polyplax serrata TaxID=468196 RepID=A0ABR1AV30_POLSC